MDTFRLNVEAVRRNLPDRGPPDTDDDADERLAERIVEVQPLVEGDADSQRPARG